MTGLRGLAKSGIACGLQWSGVDRARRLFAGGRRMPWIVGYHRVVEDFGRSAAASLPAMLVGVRTLERHLDWIADRYQPLSLDEIAARLESGRGFRRPSAAITFDDGYRDVYEHAMPLLVRKGIPAAIFVVTGHIGTGRPLPHDRLYPLLKRLCASRPAPWRVLDDLLRTLGLEVPAPAGPRSARAGTHALLRRLLETVPRADLDRVAEALHDLLPAAPGAPEEHRPLDWAMVEAMRRAGFVIGSHTRTHALLTGGSAAETAPEIAGSRADLQARLGGAVDHFAYPNGWFDRACVDAVAAAGYRCAFTACRHADPARPLLTLPRTLLWERSGIGVFGRFSTAVMACEARGTFDFGDRCGPAHDAPREAAS